MELEKVNEFVYLGVTFTTQLAYTKHLEKVNAKARAKIGQIFAMTPVENVNAKLAEELFNVYIQPVYEYCAAIWTSKVSKKSIENMNRVQQKYWKRYLQVPKCASTDITYLLSGTVPLSEKIFKNPTRQLESINLSINLHGHQLNLVRNKPAQEEEYSFQKDVPVKFWEIIEEQYTLPANKFLRRKFTSKLYDLKHKHFCNRNFKKDFHNCADPQKCKCKNCKLPMNWYHDCQFILDTVGANVSNVASK